MYVMTYVVELYRCEEPAMSYNGIEVARFAHSIHQTSTYVVDTSPLSSNLSTSPVQRSLGH